MSREGHKDGVGFAGLKLNELMAKVAVAHEFAKDECTNLVVIAVGDQPTHTSGQNALGGIVQVTDDLEGILGKISYTIQELNDYDRGW
jgi:hypothetical protein